MKKIGLRKALELFGAKNIKLRKLYGGEQVGFFEGTGLNPDLEIFGSPIFKENQTYYIMHRDSEYLPGRRVMYRTARDRNDFTGGANQWNFEDVLRKLGYELR